MSAPRPLVLWVVGPPGAGKTTLVRALLDAADPRGQRYTTAGPKWTVVPGRLTLAGHYVGGTFDGADTVPYNGVEPALRDWAASVVLQNPLTVLDGDRFSHGSALRFFDRGDLQAFVRDGPDVRTAAVLLTAPSRVLAERRAERGSKQNPAWVLGRETKARRFAESLGRDHRAVDASGEPAVVFPRLLAALADLGWP
jgi:hypothetical protein